MNIEKMFTTIDTHVAGEAFRIIVHSPISLNESSLELNQRLIEEKFKCEKALLLNEPRGHRGMSGCIVIPSKMADYACVFVNHGRDGQFKYGGLVATVTALLESGNMAKNENNVYEIETLSGVHSVFAPLENQEVKVVHFESGKCEILENTEVHKVVEIDHNRKYLIYHLPESISTISIKNLSLIKKWGKQITEKMAACIQFEGIIMMEAIDLEDNIVRSITFEKDGSIVRTPGIDSTFAIFTGLLEDSKNVTQLTNHSIFDSSITAKLLAGKSNRYAVEIQGFVTGTHQFIYDQEDPLPNGFLLK